MHCRFSFKHMDTSEALINCTETKVLAKVDKLSFTPIDIHVTFFKEAHENYVCCTILGEHGTKLQAKAQCKNMYKAVDRLAEKLEAQLKRQKGKQKHIRFTKSDLSHLTYTQLLSTQTIAMVPNEL